MNKKYFALAIVSTLFLKAPSKASYAMGAQVREPSPASTYAHLDPRRLINRQALQAAINYFDARKSSFANQKVMSVIDFTLHSGKARFFVVDMNSGAVEAFFTAHGSGSDPDHNGFADHFSNVPESKKSSLGFYRTGTTYSGGHGYSLYLDGLSATNSKARERLIVVHPASYVDPRLPKMGRSWGCPALPTAQSAYVINKIKGGSLMYAYGG